MLQFGRVICLVALVITTMISDLHLAGKLMLRPVQVNRQSTEMAVFLSVTKSNIEM